MLVLSFSTDESAIIGEDIKVQVVRIETNKVRLGFSEPPRIGIWREEVFRKIKADGRLPSQNPVKVRPMDENGYTATVIGETQTFGGREWIPVVWDHGDQTPDFIEKDGIVFLENNPVKSSDDLDDSKIKPGD